MTLRQKILLLGLVAIAGMSIALWRQYAALNTEYRATEAISHNVEVVAALSLVAHELQRERGLTVFTLAGAHHPTTLAEEIERTDAAMERLVKTGRMPPGLDTALQYVRTGVVDGSRAPLVARDDFSSLLITLIDAMNRLAREPNIGLAKNDIAAHTYLVAMKEYLGQTRATLAYWIVNPHDGRRAFESLIRIKSLFDEEWRKFELEASPSLRKEFRSRFSGAHVNATQEAMLTTLMTARLPARLEAHEWLNMSTVAIDRLFDLENVSLQLIEQKAAHRLGELRDQMARDMATALVAAAFVLALTVSAVVSLLRALAQTLSGMERIARSQDFGSRIPADSADEIGRIARSFNALLDVAERLLHEKESLAATDPLTGISNRLRFAQVLAEEAQRKLRNKTAMALIVLDIDHFKKVNDTYGHNVGDEVLKHLVRLVTAEIRATDFFGRWGGEEFILLLRDDDCNAARATADKLRRLIAEEKFPVVGSITCSFGVTGWEESDTVASLVSRADRALYASKNDGRNKVSCDKSTQADCLSCMQKNNLVLSLEESA